MINASNQDTSRSPIRLTSDGVAAKTRLRTYPTSPSIAKSQTTRYRRGVSHVGADRCVRPVPLHEMTVQTWRLQAEPIWSPAGRTHRSAPTIATTCPSVPTRTSETNSSHSLSRNAGSKEEARERWGTSRSHGPVQYLPPLLPLAP